MKASTYSPLQLGEEANTGEKDGDKDVHVEPRKAEEEVIHGKGGPWSWVVFGLVSTAIFLMNGSYSVILTVLPDGMRSVCPQLPYAISCNRGSDLVYPAAFPVTEELDCNLNDAIWISIAPILVATGFMPVAGMLGDTYGHRHVWLCGMVIRGFCQLLAGYAPSLTALVIARCISGFGGAIDSPTGTALVIRAFPKDRKPLFLGLMSALRTVSQSLGLLVGGLVAQVFGWRAVFIGPGIIIWIILLCSGAVLYGCPERIMGDTEAPSNSSIQDPDGSSSSYVARCRERWDQIVTVLQNFDFKGTALLQFTTTTLMLGITGAPTRPVAFTILMFLAAMGCGAYLVKYEQAVPKPIFPVDLLSRGPVLGALLGNLCLWLPYMGSWLFLPLYLRGVLGYSPAKVASLVLIRPFANAASNAVGGQLLRSPRTKQWFTIQTSTVLGACLTIPGYALLLHIVSTGSQDMFFFEMTLCTIGIGVGFAYNAIIVFMTNSAADNRLGSAIGIVGMSQQLSLMCSYSVVSALLPDASVPLPQFEFTITCVLWVSLGYCVFPIWSNGYSHGVKAGLHQARHEDEDEDEGKDNDDNDEQKQKPEERQEEGPGFGAPMGIDKPYGDR